MIARAIAIGLVLFLVHQAATVAAQSAADIHTARVASVAAIDAQTR